MLLSALLLLLLLLLQAGSRCAAAPLRTSAGGGVELNGRNPRTSGRGARSHHEGNHRDPLHKERIIIQLTGPLYFDPKCKKQFHRLYNNTRDCTVPAYYRRCARLLKQLAKSPRCVER